MIELEKLWIALGVDRSGFSRELNASVGEARSWGNILQGVLQGVGQKVTQVLIDMGRAAVREFNRSIDAASDLSESINKSSVVFGQNATEVVNWSKTTADALGQSQRQALEAAGTFGNLFTSMGLARDASAEMSTGLVELASDLASFNNIEPDVALEKLRAGIVGEVEPLRTLGINLSAATVEAKAMEMGLAATTKQLTEADKVTARYALILEQSTNAQGDFARTADGAANAQRRVNAQLDNYRTMAGRVFLPFREQTLGILADVLQNMAPYAENIMDQFAAGLARGIVAITPVLVQLKELFVFWLKPGSPPRLLPDLTRWGLGAANAWREGWTRADFNILGGITGSVRGLLSSMVAGGRMPEGGLFDAIMGSRSALASAIGEFAATGSVSEDTFRRIRESAGDAGQSVEALTRAYFDLERASRQTQAAQDELAAVQERYNEALTPITGELGDIAARQQEIRDRQRIDDLKRTINSRNSTGDERELALLELRAIELRRQQALLEDERDTAVDAAQAKLEAAQMAEQAAQDALDLQKANIAQEQEYNNLLADRQRLLDQMAAEAKRAYEQMQAEAQRAYQAAQADAERLANAQLSYQLAVADTPGQIEILRGELSKYTEGQAEYWQILTQIQGLEERLQREREAAATAGGGAGAGIAALGEAGSNAVEGLGAASEGVQALTDAMQGLFEALGLLPETANPAFQETTEGLTALLTEGREDANTETGGMIADISDTLRLSKAVLTGDWETVWDALYEIVDRMSTESEGRVEDSINEFELAIIRNRGDVVAAWQETFNQTKATAETGGEGVAQGFWDRFRTKWSEFQTWLGPTLAAAANAIAGLTAPAPVSVGGYGGGGGSGGFGGSSRSAAVIGPSSNSTTINYAPVLNFNGNADPAAVGRETRAAGDEFMRQWNARGNN